MAIAQSCARGAAASRAAKALQPQRAATGIRCSCNAVGKGKGRFCRRQKLRVKSRWPRGQHRRCHDRAVGLVDYRQWQLRANSYHIGKGAGDATCRRQECAARSFSSAQ